MPVPPGFEFRPLDREEFERVCARATAIRQVARAFNVSPDVVRHRCQLWGIPVPTQRETIHATELEALAAEGAFDDTPGLSEAERDEHLVEYLQRKGFMLSKDVRQENRRFVRQTKTFDGESFRVGLVSDTHLLSKFQQLTNLHAAYDYFVSEGIDTVLHTGDMTAGNGRMYRGQEYELVELGADAQRDYTVKHYPRREGLQTLVIAGNHDLSHKKTSGMDIVRGICEKRDDLTYLGMTGAYVDLHGVDFYLLHPSGGVGYARSYRLQKLVEQFAPQNKPKVFLVGHYHVTCLLECYRNVYSYMMPCFEMQTPYLLEKGLYPEVGFATLTVTVGKGGDFVKASKEFVPFFEPIAEDY